MYYMAMYDSVDSKVTEMVEGQGQQRVKEYPDKLS